MLHRTPLRRRPAWVWLVGGLATAATVGAVVAPPPAVQVPLHMDDVTRLVDERTYVTAMTTDAGGDLWVGTESAGVWRFDPRDQTWVAFTRADGLGDDSAYALACDPAGRVWVGHGRHGVSVYNGQRWQNYGVLGGDAGDRGPAALAGPIGERVFALAVCPTTGDVWMATSGGLTRFAAATGVWSTLTRADGLPSDAADAIAFDPAGNVYVGLATDGVAMADAADGYARWRQVTASFRPDPATAAGTGTGLPSGYVNDVMVARDGRVYVGTPLGLAWSDDRGATWRYVRGADWAEKAQMDALPTPPRWDGRRSTFPKPMPARPPRGGADLAEDYVEAVGETPTGRLLVGYRRRGWQAFDRDAGGDSVSGLLTAGPPSSPTADSCVRALPRGGNGYPCVGQYLTGDVDPLDGLTNPSVAARPSPAEPPPLPPGAPPPDGAARAAAVWSVPAVGPQPMPAGTVVPLADDWLTQGAWLGRYGRYWCVLPAIDMPKDYVWGAATRPVPWSLGIGHVAPPTEYTRYDSRKPGDDPRALELPPILYDAHVRLGFIKAADRGRFTTRNDGSLHYPQTMDGPNLVYRLDVPAGTFVLSAYEVNGDEHDSPANYRRDFGIVVRSADGTPADAAVPPRGTGGTDLDRGTVLATARVRDFGTGVYKRFLVRGPAALAIEVARDYSFVTTTSGLMLDLADPCPPPFYPPTSRPAGTHRQAVPSGTEAVWASNLTAELARLRDENPAWWAVHHRPLCVGLAQWYAAHPEAADPADRAAALYGANLFAAAEAVDAAAGRRTARDVERSLKWDGHTNDNSGAESQALIDAGIVGADGVRK